MVKPVEQGYLTLCSEHVQKNAECSSAVFPSLMSQEDKVMNNLATGTNSKSAFETGNAHLILILSFHTCLSVSFCTATSDYNPAQSDWKSVVFI